MDDDYKQEWLAEQHKSEDEAQAACPFERGVSALTEKEKEHRLWQNLGMEVGGCPYCGSLRATTVVQSLTTGRWGVDCRACNGGLPTNFATAKEAVERFNERALTI